jgi:hypothetical protein
MGICRGLSKLIGRRPPTSRRQGRSKQSSLSNFPTLAIHSFLEDRRPIYCESLNYRRAASSRSLYTSHFAKFGAQLELRRLHHAAKPRSPLHYPLPHSFSNQSHTSCTQSHRSSIHSIDIETLHSKLQATTAPSHHPPEAQQHDTIPPSYHQRTRRQDRRED